MSAWNVNVQLSSCCLQETFIRARLAPAIMGSAVAASGFAETLLRMLKLDQSGGSSQLGVSSTNVGCMGLGET